MTSLKKSIMLNYCSAVSKPRFTLCPLKTKLCPIVCNVINNTNNNSQENKVNITGKAEKINVVWTSRNMFLVSRSLFEDLGLFSESTAFVLFCLVSVLDKEIKTG